MRSADSSEDRTVDDFGHQWSHFPNPSDAFHSSELILMDTLQGLFDPRHLKGKRVIEIGAGSGRVLEMLRKFDPSELVGVEPSTNALTLASRFAADPIVKIVHADGTTPLSDEFDVCFIIGVLHHIPEPLPVLKNVREMLADDGVLVVWVYGREGRVRIAVLAIQVLRVLTVRLPDRLLVFLSRCLARSMRLYGRVIAGLNWLNLPLRDYLDNVFLRCSKEKQVEIVFDQLNPQCARYYSRTELREQLVAAGFTEIRVAVRHNYSITAVGSC